MLIHFSLVDWNMFPNVGCFKQKNIVLASVVGMGYDGAELLFKLKQLPQSV